jgi:2-amino-4-hydroxy-6-hydroxymethyldihydropteridine diphosphokinase
MRVGIALGSNLGDRGAGLLAGFGLLKALDSGVIVSGIYESDPVDCPEGSPPFLNAVAEMEFGGDLCELLDRLQGMERKLGRAEVRERNAPRPLDLDILYADDLVLREERLILPHPRMAERTFVLQPLAEIAPGRVLPGFDRDVTRLLEDLLLKGATPCRRIG